MSELTEFLDEEIKPLCDSFFDKHAHQYNLSTDEGSGQYMEALIENLRTLGKVRMGHLKKNPGQTQYNGHATDAFLYRQGDPSLYRAVDVIGGSGGPNPTKNFGIDIPRYQDSDWLAVPVGGQPPIPQPNLDTIPWASYWGDPASDKITRTFMFDYSRKPESLNPGFGRWVNRCVHSAFIGPVPPSQGGRPLGIDGALARHRPELCAALGGGASNSNIPVPDDFFPEWK